MNVSYFIAKRLATSKEYKNSVSAPIIKIAIAAVILSMIMIIVSIGTGTGLQIKIREKISSFAGHITISNFDNNQTDITLTPINKHQVFYPKFQDVPEVKSIQPIATKAGVVRTNETFEGIVFKGVDKNYHWDFLKDFLTQGKMPSYKENSISNEVILSEYLANRLKIKVGDKIQTYFMKSSAEEMPFIRGFDVVGLFNSGMSQFDESLVFGDLKQVQRMNRWNENEIGAFELLVNDFEKIEEVNNKVYESIPSELDTTPITQKFISIFEWMKLFDTNIYIILILMILVGTINMIVALMVLILERTKMIGILKALGTSNWSIRKVFVYQATYILLYGLFFGNVIGIGLLLIQDYFKIIKLDPSQYHVKEAPVNIDVFSILSINILFIIVCYTVMLLPSYIITKISPIQAIKND